jgi:hypothetical protein
MRLGIAALIGVIIVLAVAMVLLGSAVVRLESYRYADLVGFCGECSSVDPWRRIEREKCLKAATTRTHWLWHIYYAVAEI